MDRRHSFAVIGALGLAACVVPVGPGGPPDAGVDGGTDAGGTDSGSTNTGDVDAGGPISAVAGQWTWVPVDGSRCASGSTTGFGVNMSDVGDDLFIYLQGGGACWNTGTCIPSLVQYGPVCNYGNTCPYNVGGGTQPLAAHVLEPDPFPVDGGGDFPGEIAALSQLGAWNRVDATNPFRTATFVYVPYCTADIHDGQSTQTYSYQFDAGDPIGQYTVHFAGASNMALFLRKLHVTLPNVKRVWITGSSAGGYGATLNFERTRTEFSSAQVHLLGDSSPFISTYHWPDWIAAWSPVLPSGCNDCDAGLPQIFQHLVATYPDSRIGLIDDDHDGVVAWYFLGQPGTADVISPPEAAFNAELLQLETTFDSSSNAKYFTVPGANHVLWGGYGITEVDGGLTPPLLSADGGTNLKDWIDAWATGSAPWSSTR